MENLIFKLAAAAVVFATMLIQAARPLPVIVESTEFETGSYGRKTVEYAGNRRRLHSVGPHVKRKSIEIPKLVQDLYRNVTAISDSQDKYPTIPMSYNTVRSFKGIINEDCSNLTFDVAAIEEREFIFKAEVYLEITYSVDVEIELWLTENIRVPPTVLNRPSTMTTSSETVVFQIGKYLVDLVDSDNFTGSLHFSLITWKIDANNQVKLTCNIPNGVLEIKRGDPSLVVYSYDTKEELLETIQKKLLDSSTSTTLPPSVRLNKRESSDHPCTRLSLDVDKKVLNDIMEGTHRTIALPDVFDTGVCAGSCLGSLAQETLHSSILHLLLSSTPNEPAKINDTTVYQKCCAPVEYSAMSMITLLQKPNHPPVYEIKVFHDLSVKRCACIYSRI